jgi:hypothetical protein
MFGFFGVSWYSFGDVKLEEVSASLSR